MNYALVVINIQMNRIQDLIYQALNVKDNNVLRSQAEAEIFQLFKENITEFFYVTATIVGDENKQVIPRQSTASVMKTLLARKDDDGKWFWDYVQPNFRPQIKDTLLSTLVAADLNIMRAGANAIAQIAAIEIPRGEWLEIVNTLAENSQHEDYNIRRASITTLGYICQELKSVNADINSLSCEQILGCLLLGASEQGIEIIEISLHALRDSIPFLKNILENQTFCNKTIEILFSMLENPEYRGKVYEILFEFGKYCYPLLDNYINAIIQFTVAHIQERSDNSILALQLWDTIGTEYLERRENLRDRVNNDNYQINNIVQMVHGIVLPEIMACILIIKPSDVEFAELRESAVKALGTFVECGNREIVDKVTEGVTSIIQSSNAGERQASALLFGCLSQYEDRNYIEHCFTNGFNHLFTLLSDSEYIVRKNTLNGFVTLSEFFKEVFMKNPNIRDIFNHLISLAKDKDEDIRILSLTILSYITEILKEYPDPIAKQPDVYLRELVNLFVQNLKTQQYKESNEKAIIVIMNLVMHTERKEIINQLINYLVDQYNFYTKNPVQDRQIVLEHILTIIHTCVLSLSKFVNNSEIRDKIYDLIDLHIKLYGIEPEGVNMISAAAICFKKDFKIKIELYWGYIEHSLDSIEQKPLFKAALSCISDIARTYENEIVAKITTVFHKLISYMYGNIDREVKTDILKCFGDLILGLKRYGEMFVDTLLAISGNCFEAVDKLSDIQNERTYAEELKDALIEMYHCLLFSVNDQIKCNSKMANHFPIISSFIVRTCDVKYKPTVDYIKNCLYLVFDAALLFSANESYRDSINRILESNQIRGLIDSLKKYRGRQDVNDVLVFIEDKLRMRR